MAKLAWSLAQAFTTGRKSAPVEFHQVENQLYSLSAALGALKDARADGGAAISINPARLPSTFLSREADNKHTIDSMLRSCEGDLKHLEQIVKKYGSIAESQGPDKPLLKRWSRDLIKDWKKIAWTTEKGNLAALRSQLTLHTNSLNLVLGIVIKFVPPFSLSCVDLAVRSRN